MTHEFKNISPCLYIAQDEKSVSHVLEYWSDIWTLSLSPVFLSQTGNKELHELHLGKCLNQSLDL